MLLFFFCAGFKIVTVTTCLFTSIRKFSFVFFILTEKKHTFFKIHSDFFFPLCIHLTNQLEIVFPIQFLFSFLSFISYVYTSIARTVENSLNNSNHTIDDEEFLASLVSSALHWMLFSCTRKGPRLPCIE